MLAVNRKRGADRYTRVMAPKIRFGMDLYGALTVKRLLLGSAANSLFGAGKAVLHPVVYDQVPEAAEGVNGPKR